jgi:hypothetical protein
MDKIIAAILCLAALIACSEGNATAHRHSTRTANRRGNQHMGFVLRHDGQWSQTYNRLVRNNPNAIRVPGNVWIVCAR